MDDIHQFVEPINVSALNSDETYNDGQLAKHILAYEDDLPDLSDADIVLVGINETRGDGMDAKISPADAIRRQLYQLYYWHTDIQIADIGNIKRGATIADSYAAVKTVLSELLKTKKP